MELHAFLIANKATLIQRWLGRVRATFSSEETRTKDVLDTLPIFLEHVVEALCAGADWGPAPPNEPRELAKIHGDTRLRIGFTPGEMIAEYGVLVDTVLGLAEETGNSFRPAEYRRFMECIYVGAAYAAAEYAQGRDRILERQAAQHTGFLAHELRTPLTAARVALDLFKRRGFTRPEEAATVLARNLDRLGRMVDDALTSTRLRAVDGAPTPAASSTRIDVERVVAEVLEEAAPEADARGLQLCSVLETGGRTEIDGDARVLHSALSNLVRNALKFTLAGTRITVHVRTPENRVTIEVEDHCGGLRTETVQELFSPYVQANADRSGFGLGLAITRQAAESLRGEIKVRNKPGSGCTFVLDLPAAASPGVVLP